MLSYIKRKLSESDTSGSNVQDNTTTNNCDVSTGQSDNNNKISTNNNSGSGNGSGVVGTVLDTLIRKASQMSLIKQSSSIDQAIAVGQDALLQDLGYKNATELRETIYDLLRTIRDPEKPATLEDLNVVYEEGIFVQPPTQSNVYVVRIEFNPTVPHCSLATLIGLCIRIKIERSLPHMLKLDIYIKKGMHNTEDEINKQVNDKERVAAAMENPNLYNLVENCIKEDD